MADRTALSLAVPCVRSPYRPCSVEPAQPPPVTTTWSRPCSGGPVAAPAAADLNRSVDSVEHGGPQAASLIGAERVPPLPEPVEGGATGQGSSLPQASGTKRRSKTRLKIVQVLSSRDKKSLTRSPTLKARSLHIFSDSHHKEPL